MATDYYHISLSTDVVGIESAVALKNGYALGVALTIGLNQRERGIDSGLHYNSQAAVFGQAAKEMAKLLALQGAGTLDNLCVGVGDLYVTVYGGRTRLVGILLGRGLTIAEAKRELAGVTLESLVVAERASQLAKLPPPTTRSSSTSTSSFQGRPGRRCPGSPSPSNAHSTRTTCAL
jgi:glycerol-3-phosphate dehydrogenase (NAD(P)+)